MIPVISVRKIQTRHHHHSNIMMRKDQIQKKLILTITWVNMDLSTIQAPERETIRIIIARPSIL